MQVIPISSSLISQRRHETDHNQTRLYLYSFLFFLITKRPQGIKMIIMEPDQIFNHFDLVSSKMAQRRHEPGYKQTISFYYSFWNRLIINTQEEGMSLMINELYFHTCHFEFISSLWESMKTITPEEEGDGDINDSWSPWNGPQEPGKETRLRGDHPDHCIIKINDDTLNSPGGLQRLADTQTLVKKYQLVRKFSRSIIKSCWHHGIPWFPLTIHPNNPSLLSGLLGWILCQYRDEACKSWLVGQHWNIHVCDSIRERRLWIRLDISSNAHLYIYLLFNDISTLLGYLIPNPPF